MEYDHIIKPEFIIIGAQKSGTTWLWEALRQHPEISFPEKKEIHYFGGVENYNKGKDWYYDHFSGLDRTKTAGEASTTYLYDYLPYWHNRSSEIEIDGSLPPIPKLINEELPGVKILVILRDPVSRAMSAYRHNLKKYRNDKRKLRVLLEMGPKGVALEYPKDRILEYGYYARYLRIWRKYVATDQMRVYLFEEDVRKYPERTMAEICNFLGIDENFSFSGLRAPVHETWSVTRCWLYSHADPISKKLIGRFGRGFDKKDFLYSRIIKDEDIEFFRNSYLEEKAELEHILERPLDCWSYGEAKTASSLT